MIQTSFLAVFLSSDIYERPMFIQLTSFTMTVHADFIPRRFIRNWLLHVLAKDGVSVFVCWLILHTPSPEICYLTPTLP